MWTVWFALLKSAVSIERCAELSHVPAWLDHEMHYFKEPYQNLSFIVLRCIFFLSMYCQINSSMWVETFWVVFIKGASFLRGQMPPLHKRQIEFWHEKRVDGYEKRSMHEISTVTYQILAPFAIILNCFLKWNLKKCLTFVFLYCNHHSFCQFIKSISYKTW